MVRESDVSELRRARFTRRMPARLSALEGPRHGVVELPLHLCWSGLSRFDLDQPRLLMSCYRIVLAEGLREDLSRYLNRDILLAIWPTLRTLIGRELRESWESAFPELSRAVRG